jgi:hypothetical protein
MATAKHGRKGLIYLDMSAGANSAASKVPMLVDWSIDRTTDSVETTSCDSENKEYVSGLADYSGQFSANMDADSDALYQAADGQARMHYFYPDRDAVAGKRRYNYGLIRIDASESGGATAKLGQSVTFKAAGPITRVFV